MKLRLFQVDAFARELFHGNPAAVVPLEKWLPDAVLQAIAAENALSETAFFVPDGEGYHLRWLTPSEEVTFCGHATLASAHVLLRELRARSGEVHFRALCGNLLVREAGDLLAMDAPNWEPSEIDPPRQLLDALGKRPRQVLAARDYFCIFDSEEDVQTLSPDMARLASLDRLGVIVTAPGNTADFVSRFFAPRVGVPEDPVTGSAHSSLTPYWAKRLGKTKLRALQLSKRGGEIFCELRSDRVITAGHAVKYLEGEIEIPG